MSRRRLLPAAIAFALGLPLALPAAAVEVQLLVPAYFYPSIDPAQSEWDELSAAAAAGARVTAIANPDNGPGGARNGDYVRAIDTLRAAGGRVLGYVYTCYGRNPCAPGLPPTRSIDDVVADAERWAAWYGVDGLFLDEMSNDPADLGFYTALAGRLRAAHPGWRLVGNPGTGAPEVYLQVADTLVVFEGRGSNAAAPREPWMDQADPGRLAHLVYDVADADAMRRVVDEAAQQNVGWVYATDDRYLPGDPGAPNPWDRLPSYWGSEAALATPSGVTEPPPAALLALALAGVAWRRPRHPRGG